MTPAEPANSLTTIDDLVALFKKGDAAAVSELTGIWHAQGDDALRVGIARYISRRMTEPEPGSRRRELTPDAYRFADGISLMALCVINPDYYSGKMINAIKSSGVEGHLLGKGGMRLYELCDVLSQALAQDPLAHTLTSEIADSPDEGPLFWKGIHFFAKTYQTILEQVRKSP